LINECTRSVLFPQYRPVNFDSFVVHKDIADNLKKLVSGAVGM